MYVGLDVHKTYNQACVMNESGDIVKEQRFLNTKEELDQFLESIPENSVIGIEACSVWQAIYEEIESKGFDVRLAHPMDTQLIAKSKVKTDKIDAQALAKLLRLDEFPQAYVPPEHMRKLREIVRHRYALVKLRSHVKNMVHGILNKTGNQLELTDIFGKTGMLTMRSMEFNIQPQYRFQLNHYLDLIGQINQMIEETNTYIDTQAAQISAVELLKSIPGIGTYSALLLYAEIGEITRFNNYKQLCSYAGITASVYQSGQTLRHGHITKQGNRLVRWILIQAVLKTANKPNTIQRFYKKMLNKKGMKIAKVASARKLLVYIYIMLTHNVRFDQLRVNSG